MVSRAELARIRKLLAGADLETVLQGVAVVRALDDPELYALMSEGISVSARGDLGWSGESEIVRRVSRQHRVHAAFELWAGAAERPGVERLRLGSWRRGTDLTLLDRLPDLKHLSMDVDLASCLGLDRLGRLESLTLGWGCGDLSPLAAVEGLVSLRVGNCYLMETLRSLPPLRSLRSLSLARGTRLWSLQGLERLPQLTELSLDGMPDLERLGALERLPALETLRIAGCPKAVDLSGLAGKATLRRLALRGDRWLPEMALGFLTSLTGLEALRLEGASWLEDVSWAGALGGLRELALTEAISLADLSPLAALSALEELSLRNSQQIADLSPLAGMPEMRRLDLRGCAQVRDLTPLAGMTKLDMVQLGTGGPLRGLQALAGAAGLVRGAYVDDDGRPTSPGGALRGTELLVALAVEGEALAGARSVDLAGCPEVSELSLLADLRALREVDLSRCEGLAEPTALALLPALERLEMSGCAAARPRPPRLTLTGRAAVDGYQRKLARALKRRSDRSPQEDRWLEALTARGMLASAPERGVLGATGHKAIRALMRSPDREDAAQALSILEALDDPHALAEYAEGLSLSDEGLLQVAPHVARRPHLRRDRRGWVALSLLRMTGALDGVERLALDERTELYTLSPLEGLTALRALSVHTSRTPDLSGIQELPALESLTIGHTRDLRDPSALAGCASLRELELGWGLASADLNFLAGLTGLERLSISATGLQDISALAGLTGLRELELVFVYMLTDLSPLAGLTELRALRVQGARRLTDLAPLAGLTNLETLSLRRSALRDLSPLAGLTGLRTLRLDDNYTLEEFSPLASLTSLERLGLTRCYGLPERRWAKLYRGQARIAKLLQRIEDARSDDGAS